MSDEDDNDCFDDIMNDIMNDNIDDHNANNGNANDDNASDDKNGRKPNIPPVILNTKEIFSNELKKNFYH